MKKLAGVKNQIAVKLTRRLTKSKKKTARDPSDSTNSKPDEALADFAKKTSAFSRFVSRPTATMLFAIRSGVTLDAKRKQLSQSKNRTLAGFAKFMAWLRTPLATRPEYLKFKKWLRTPLTPRSLLPVAAIWALAVIFISIIKLRHRRSPRARKSQPE